MKALNARAVVAKKWPRDALHFRSIVPCSVNRYLMVGDRAMIHRLTILLTVVLILFAADAGCCTVTPSQDQIEVWVRTELPRGSTDSDVRAFCVRHHFFYDHNGMADRTGVELLRPLDGCDSQKPVATITITYDADGRIVEAVTRTFGLTF